MNNLRRLIAALLWSLAIGGVAGAYAASSVTNQAIVSGGGESNLANDTANDPTSILPFNITSITHLANGHIVLTGLAAPNQSNTIQATTDLTQQFQFLATFVPDASGAFQFEDQSAGNFTQLFYRLSYVAQTPTYTQSQSFACNQETCNGLPLDQGGQWQFIEANDAFSLYQQDASGHIIFGMYGNPGNPGTGGISNLQDKIPEPPNTNGASGGEGQLTFNYSAVDYSNNSIHYNGLVVANGHEVRQCSVHGCWDVMIVDNAQIYINGLDLSSSSLNFGLQEIGSTSPSQTVTVTNVSKQSVTFTSITSSGDFPESNTCPSTLNAGLNCTITVAFRPTAAGNRTGAVTLTDNDPGSPTQTIALTGIGAANAMTLIPSSLSFPGQIPGTTASQSITLYNDGTAAVNNINIGISPASTTFTQTNNCQSTLNPNTNCVIQVSFTPPDSGTFNATLSITDSDTSSPQTASLSGVGLD